MFVIAPFTIANMEKAYKSIGRKMDKENVVYITFQLKKKKILQHTITLIIHTLSEISQSQKDKFCTYSIHMNYLK
jgi:hypothetical protein